MPIRLATFADLPQIIAIEQQSQTAAHWAASEYQRILTSGVSKHLVLVADEASAILGFLVATAAGPEWTLDNIVVAPDAQKRGLRSQLLSALLSELGKRKAEAVFLEVRESNLAAIRAYEKSGFVLVGRRRHYYREPLEDALLYRYKLT
jgi:[ribosomal protein S18]-alanine N-acetyltransferase